MNKTKATGKEGITSDILYRGLQLYSGFNNSYVQCVLVEGLLSQVMEVSDNNPNYQAWKRNKRGHFQIPPNKPNQHSRHGAQKCISK
jgi:hypothetical protein